MGQLNLLRSINMRLSDEQDLTACGNQSDGNACDAVASQAHELDSQPDYNSLSVKVIEPFRFFDIDIRYRYIENY